MATTDSDTASRLNAAPIKIVGLGLGRTGTMSLWAALERLGFGPCYHPMKAASESKDWQYWGDVIEGNDSPEAFDKILQGYQSVVDSPVAVKSAETTRAPAKWEHSLKTTVLPAYDKAKQNLGHDPRGMARWCRVYFDVYYKGHLATHAKEELEEHNEKIKKIIPADQLLVYALGQGWEPLANFLEVPVPDEPFPHLNDSSAYHGHVEQAHKNAAADQTN
ncbi:hypothetical protein M422DRAFT_269900 [Sphaerobolus stellatus SS14]|uniref:Uncharacterized protein n=1 Tax=Sphaerobolus stellatus (strain SS14) TaxID=990650 RepID=A0A0C9UU85_SPHS4|nr:hypothetical protein M422DRAFT_269900 [Sphaerobolus stellatus SS14]